MENLILYKSIICRFTQLYKSTFARNMYSFVLGDIWSIVYHRSVFIFASFKRFWQCFMPTSVLTTIIYEHFIWLWITLNSMFYVMKYFVTQLLRTIFWKWVSLSMTSHTLWGVELPLKYPVCVFVLSLPDGSITQLYQ